MILTTTFAGGAAVVGGVIGAQLGAFDGKPLRHMFFFGAMAGGVCGGGGFVLDHAFGNFDEPAPQVITADQQKSISECFSDAPDGMDSVITLASDGTVKCLYAPK